MSEKEKMMSNMDVHGKLNLKMVVFVVRKGMGTKVSTEARKCGATRRVVLYGKGTAPKKVYLDILGIEYEPEKEIVLMLAQKKCLKNLLETITQLSHIDRPGQGIGFVIDVSQYAGWLNFPQEMPEGDKDQEDHMSEKKGIEFDLIITIVNRDNACEVVTSSKRAGAEGGTIIAGRGSGIHDNKKIFGILVEPEKEIVLTLVDKNISAEVLKRITHDLKLDEPGHGVAFLMKVEETAGICHLCHLQKPLKP